MLTDGDRQWLESKFSAIYQKIDEGGSKIHRMDTELKLLKAASPHKCAEEIEKHEKASWSHNPYKAGAAGVTLLGLIEGIRKFFHS